MKVDGRNGTVSMPWWAWGCLISLFLGLIAGTIGAANWMATSVINHETQIELNETAIGRHERQLDKIDEKLDRILEQVTK